MGIVPPVHYTSSKHSLYFSTLNGLSKSCSYMVSTWKQVIVFQKVVLLKGYKPRLYVLLLYYKNFIFGWKFIFHSVILPLVRPTNIAILKPVGRYVTVLNKFFMYLRKPCSTIGLLTAKQGYKDDGLQNRNFFNPQNKEFLNEWHPEFETKSNKQKSKISNNRNSWNFYTSVLTEGKKGGY